MVNVFTKLEKSLMITLSFAATHNVFIYFYVDSNLRLAGAPINPVSCTAGHLKISTLVQNSSSLVFQGFRLKYES